MTGGELLDETKRRFIQLLKFQGDEVYCRELQSEVVISRPLSVAEAIGDPGRDDFPIIRGREVLMQATFKGVAGQAFTAASGDFQGTLGDVLALPLDENFERAVFIATMNAALRYLGKIEKTVHCRDDGPKRCSSLAVDWLRDQEWVMVGLVGLQPSILEALVKAFGRERVMVSDLAEAGSEHCGVKVLDGLNSGEIFEQCQIILITGSTIVNGTIDDLLGRAVENDRRVVLFGVTIAGAAYLMGLESWCACST